MLIDQGMTAQQASDAMAVAVETGVVPTARPAQAATATPAAPKPKGVFPSFPPRPAPRPKAVMMDKEPPAAAATQPTGRRSDGAGRLEPKRGDGYAKIEGDPRRWASADSKFTLEGGRLVGVHPNGQVDILRPDGRVVHPHFSELSHEDQQHIRVQRERGPMAAAEAAEKNVVRQRAAGFVGRPATAERKAKEAQAALRAARAPLPAVGAALPRADQLANDAYMIDNLEGADPRPARQAAPKALPKGFTPVNIAEQTWSSGQHSRTGRVVGVHQDGTVLIEGRDGTQSKIPVWKLDGKDAARLRASLPGEISLGMQMFDPAELEKAHRERAEWMLGEKEGRLGDGRDKADTDRKLAEFRRQRRAGMRPGTDAEQQYEMFGPGGDDAAARAESQAAIDAQVEAGAKRDKQVRQSIDRDKAKYGPGRGVTRFDKDGEPIAATAPTKEQDAAREARRAAEDRVRQDPSHANAAIARLARATGLSREEARAIYMDGEQGPQALRDMAGAARDAQLASQRDALRRQNMLAGNNPRANLTNAFGTMDKEWQDYVMARLMGANPGTSPSDAAIEREKLDVVRAEAEARAAEAARAGRQADRANDLAERGLGLKEKEQGLEAEARAQEESDKTRNLVIEHHGLPMPAGAAAILVKSELSAGRFDHPEVVKFIDNSAIKLLGDSRAFDDNVIDDEEVAAVDAILARLGVGYQPGSWRKAADAEAVRLKGVDERVKSIDPLKHMN